MQQVKMVGTNGQISLGKEFAGKMVLIDQVEIGTWIIKTGEFVPDSEQWLYEGDHLEKLKRGLNWAKKNPPQDNFNKIIKKLEKDGNKN